MTKNPREAIIEKLPLVSIVIPSYNRSYIVTDAIESAQNQTYKNIEIILIDDGSTDETKQLVIKQFGDAVTYVYKQNGGASSARNLGINRSNGKYIAFLDSDDDWGKTKISKQVDYMENNAEYGMVLCEVNIFDANGKCSTTSLSAQGFYQNGWVFESFLKNMIITCSCMFIRNNVFNEIGMFDESLETAEDKDLMLRISAKFKIGAINEALVNYRKANDSLSNNVMAGNSIRALKKIANYAPNLYEKHFKLITRQIGTMHYCYADDLLWNKKYSEARQQINLCSKYGGNRNLKLLYIKSFLYQAIKK